MAAVASQSPDPSITKIVEIRRANRQRHDCSPTHGFQSVKTVCDTAQPNGPERLMVWSRLYRLMNQSLVVRGRNMRMLLLGVVAALMPFYVSTAKAGDLHRIKAVIERQIAGLREDNSRLLSSAISVQTRLLFADDRTLLDTFKRNFPGAMGVRIVGFDIARRTEHGFVQPAQISDRTGRLWRVVYAVERDDTGQWLIKDFVSFEIPTVSS